MTTTHSFRASSLGALLGLCGAAAGLSALEPACGPSLGDGGSGSDSTSASSGSSTTYGSRSGGASGSSGSAQATAGSVTGSGSDSGATKAEAAAPPMRGPTPASSTSKFPFPQNRQQSRCFYPTNYTNDDVRAAYTLWKHDLVVPGPAPNQFRVQRLSTDSIDGCRPLNSSVSEGIAYGMLLSVYMDDETLFDGLWLYEQQYLDSNGLMNWAPQGMGQTCGGAATDADEDMAFALVMADAQWGGQGGLSTPYKQAAIDQIQKIWNTEIFNYKFIRAGDGTWATNANLNPSYLAPAYYRVFRAIDPKSSDDWNAAIDQAYASIGDALTGNGNQDNGLVPGWCDDSNPGTCKPTQTAPNYQYDACRTPFRIGLDWCLFGETRAQAYVAKTSAFFSGIGVANFGDTYDLDGGVVSGHAGRLSAAFVGPAAVGAMGSSAHQSFVDDAYTKLTTSKLWAGGEYYDSSWTMLSLLMMTGNFLNYTGL